jgi:hypothetical protein
MGGGATRKGRKSQKARPKQTRKHQDMAKRLGKVFADMWKEHAKTTKRG